MVFTHIVLLFYIYIYYSITFLSACTNQDPSIVFVSVKTTGLDPASPRWATRCARASWRASCAPRPCAVPQWAAPGVTPVRCAPHSPSPAGEASYPTTAPGHARVGPRFLCVSLLFLYLPGLILFILCTLSVVLVPRHLNTRHSVHLRPEASRKDWFHLCIYKTLYFLLQLLFLNALWAKSFIREGVWRVIKLTSTFW